jgi:hypothetical protein
MRCGTLCCDRTASHQPRPSVGPLHLLPRASEAATANVSDIGHGAFAGASAHVSDHPQRSNRYADPVGGSVVGGDPTERDPTSGDLPERDLTTKPCVRSTRAGSIIERPCRSVVDRVSERTSRPRIRIYTRGRTPVSLGCVAASKMRPWADARPRLAARRAVSAERAAAHSTQRAPEMRLEPRITPGGGRGGRWRRSARAAAARLGCGVEDAAMGRRSAAAGGSLCGLSRAWRGAFDAARAGDAARAADRRSP